AEERERPPTARIGNGSSRRRLHISSSVVVPRGEPPGDQVDSFRLRKVGRDEAWPAPRSWATGSRSLASLRATSVKQVPPSAASSFATTRPIPRPRSGCPARRCCPAKFRVRSVGQARFQHQGHYLDPWGR